MSERLHLSTAYIPQNFVFISWVIGTFFLMDLDNFFVQLPKCFS
jgi:hypothetical protein